MKKDGFSLLEVILALAILGGAMAVLGEASRMALMNAKAAKDIAHAQLLCESKLAEIMIGIITPDPVERVPFDETTTDSIDLSEPAWVYSIENEQTDELGLICVRVLVTRDLPLEQHPVQFSLVRWMPDPNYVASTQTGSNSQQSGSSGTSSTTSGGSGAR
jgi:prepilin-type N-terminal cleavage/methylation domain-containing protein